ncbi:uncharacterized protein BKCO1_3100099 [Diplodia corticola]|uniref:Uncharacterized protein n=1 Tax=Diplodia corticola TaxID=236234 RepID=A0A1J9RLF1_9PEZI|nr:uncharacterized protein BKCO1_3100099 [Diplodia corticola]OJD33403.1 hypothetical protein BKCO1_3100099 [Diplodia corticola]
MVPAHLNSEQQKLVYKDKHRARLSADAPEPVWSTVAGVDVTLEHIDRVRDIPPRAYVFSEALRLAETPEDWENVGRLVEGLADAGMPMKPQWAQKLVRVAGHKGAMHVVLRALQRAPRTGLRLQTRGVVSRVMWEVRAVAADSGWGEQETDRALRWAEQVVELMESAEHCGGPDKRVPKLGDLRTLPFVIATPLELAAAQVLRYKDGVDEDGVVEAYAKGLCFNLKNFGLQEANGQPGDPTTKEASKQPNRYTLFAEATEKLRRLVPVWHALTLAQRVLKPKDRMPLNDVETYKQLEKLQKQIEATIKVMKAQLPPKTSIEKHGDYKRWIQVRNEKL